MLGRRRRRRRRYRRVWAWCEKAQAFGRTVTVKVKFADFRQITRSRTLASSMTEQTQLRQVSLDLVRSVFPPRSGIRLVGVTVSTFRADGAGGLPLFAEVG